MGTVLVTGSTDGLGRHLAGRLASEGEHVILHGRSEERLRRVQDELGTDHTSTVLADLADLHQVDALATELAARFDRIDTLVNNAGVGAGAAPAHREESTDGIELRFAVNYLAGYHLARRLADRTGNIVNVASVGQRAIDFTDPMLTRDYDGFGAYCQSKLAQIMFTLDLAAELRAQGTTVNALHPATFMNTTMVREGGITPASTVEQGATATLALIHNPTGFTGHYYNGRHEATADPQAYDPAAREALRTLSNDLITKSLT